MVRMYKETWSSARVWWTKTWWFWADGLWLGPGPSAQGSRAAHHVEFLLFCILFLSFLSFYSPLFSTSLYYFILFLSLFLCTFLSNTFSSFVCLFKSLPTLGWASSRPEVSPCKMQVKNCNPRGRSPGSQWGPNCFFTS